MSEAYKRAGVDIHAGYEAVERIKKHVQKTFRPEVLTGLGGFGALFELPVHKYRQPVLVSGTDGVGTKLKLAFQLDKHDTIGIDAVAMCVNDVAVQGAEPLFFLDYLACGKLQPEQVEQVVKGIAAGCEQAGCALIGGETAEMPGFYPDGEYDVAGFTVGIAEKEKLVTGAQIEAGDILIGLPSSGLHSNGFSLVRKLLLEQEQLDLDIPYEQLIDCPEHQGKTLGKVLLTPTRIYVKPILHLLQHVEVKGMAHITGGGFFENIPRILPESCTAEIDVGSWPIPSVFTLLQQKGALTVQDLFSTFNMGIGLVLVVRNEQAGEALRLFEEIGEKAYVLGRIKQGDGTVELAGVQLDQETSLTKEDSV
jgi:phosphoribosylformylglycinamidine cyclo-ligase